jgi:integrase
LLVEQFEHFLQASTNGRRKTKSGYRYSKGTLTQYRIVLDQLKQFEILKGKPLRICLLNRSSLQVFRQEKIYWERFFFHFSHFLFQQTGCSDNYAAGIFKVIKTFWNYILIDKGLPIGQFHKKFTVPQRAYEPIVISPSQLSFLIKDEVFEESLSEAMKKVKDILVVGCTVGLRYSDLMQLKKANLVESPEGHYLVLNTQKTRTALRLPVPDYVLRILSKKIYKKGPNLLPKLSCTNLNKYLKLLIEKAGWVQQLPKKRYYRGKAIELWNKHGETYRFCDHITAHTMRRTAITTLLMLGVPETMVRRISGHAAGSKEFYRYVQVVQEYLDEKVRNAYSELEGLSK